MSGKSLEINYEVRTLSTARWSAHACTPLRGVGDVRVQLLRLQAQLHDRVFGRPREELPLPGAQCNRAARSVG